MLKALFNKKQPDTPEVTFPHAVVEAVPELSVKDDHFYDLKNRIHAKLIEEANLEALDTLTDDEIHGEIQLIVEDFLRDKSTLLNDQERQSLITEVKDELTGLGPLEPLIRDDSFSDILCNTYKDVFVESGGVLKKTNARFVNDAHLMNIIDRIVSKVGRRIDESTPMVDARLPDGSRVNAIIPPLAVDGPILSIRRFGGKVLEMENLVQLGALTPEISTFLGKCVKARLNVMISGGTGAGKTTLLNVLSRYIPENERIVTIEDSAELQLQQEHVVRLETRPANIEGTGSVTQRDLVRNSLRMRPDRIIIGEVRGTEAFDMLQAMNTGHEGSLTTIHSNSPRDSLTRLESMLLMTGVNLPEKAMRFMVSSALDLIIQVSRVTDGSRKLMSIIEVVGMEGEIISLQEIFRYERQGLDADGKVLGRFMPTGIRPRFAERLELAGISFEEELFSPD
jgi:pilus assembly protein CpaF